MAILNFPPGPSHNDTYTANGIDYTYDSDSTSWLVDAAVGYTGSAGFTGSKGAGFTGSRGELGYTGSQGNIGYTGSEGVGYTGSSQSQALRFVYNNSGTISSNPTSGDVLFDNATPASATQVAFSTTDANGNNNTAYFTELDNFGSNTFKGYLLFTAADTSEGANLVFSVTATFTTPGTSIQADITQISGAFNPSDNDEILVTFIPAVQGAQGNIGYTGSQGQDGNDGSSVTVLGSVATIGNLPGSGNTVADAYVVQADGHLYVWDGSAWVDAGEFRGYTGSRGNTGFTGSPSTTIGFTGSRGLIGYTGSAGTDATGFTGSAGNTGFTGSPGSSGGVTTGKAIAMAMIFG